MKHTGYCIMYTLLILDEPVYESNGVVKHRILGVYSHSGIRTQKYICTHCLFWVNLLTKEKER